MALIASSKIQLPEGTSKATEPLKAQVPAKASTNQLNTNTSQRGKHLTQTDRLHMRRLIQCQNRKYSDAEFRFSKPSRPLGIVSNLIKIPVGFSLQPTPKPVVPRRTRRLITRLVKTFPLSDV